MEHWARWTIHPACRSKPSGYAATGSIGQIIYVGVDDVTATLAKITANGGSIVQPRLEVKGVVVLGLFKDPAGNSMGLIELKDGKPKTP